MPGRRSHDIACQYREPGEFLLTVNKIKHAFIFCLFVVVISGNGIGVGFLVASVVHSVWWELQ